VEKASFSTATPLLFVAILLPFMLCPSYSYIKQEKSLFIMSGCWNE